MSRSCTQSAATYQQRCTPATHIPAEEMVFEKGQPFAMRERDALWISLDGKLLLMFARHWATALASKLVGFNMIRSDTMCGCCALADVGIRDATVANCVLSFLGVWPVSCLGPRPSGDKVYAPPFYVDTWSLEPSLGCCMLRTTIGLPLWDFNGCLPSQCQGVRPRFWTPLDSNTSRHNIKREH